MSSLTKKTNHQTIKKKKHKLYFLHCIFSCVFSQATVLVKLSNFLICF